MSAVESVRRRLAMARPRTVWFLVVIAVSGIWFQVVHCLEHGSQVVYWVLHPTEPPWLTPWAVTGRDALVVSGDVAAGTELLHLGGNGLFLIGLAALWAVAVTKGVGAAEFRGLRPATVVQGLHVLEHVALTVTQLWVGRAIGVSTLFGLAIDGTAAWSYRVLFHFVVNLVATYFAVQAVAAMYRRHALFPRVELLPS